MNISNNYSRIDNSLYIGKSNPNNDDSQIDNLIKQKEALEERIEKLKEKKIDKNNPEVDAENRKKQIEELQNKIKQIEEQIRQCRLNEKKEEENTINDKKDVNSYDSYSKDKQENSSIENLLFFNNNLKSISTQNQIKMGLQGKSKILEIEISLDSSRKGKTANGKIEELNEINSKISKLDGKVITNLGKLLNQSNDIKTKENEESTNTNKNLEDSKTEKSTDINEKFLITEDEVNNSTNMVNKENETYNKLLISKYQDNKKFKNEFIKTIDLEI